MTLIARVRFPPPVFIGDVLLSSPDNGGQRGPVHLPLFQDAHLIHRPSATHFASGVTQKLSIPNPRLVVAWSGDLMQARLLTRTLDEAVRGGIHTSTEALEAIFAEDECDRLGVSIIGGIVTPEPRASNRINVANFSYNCDFMEDVRGVEVRASGTGTTAFVEMLPQLIDQVNAQRVAQISPLMTLRSEQDCWPIQHW